MRKKAPCTGRLRSPASRLSDGIWFGTPIQLAKEFNAGQLTDKLKQITHPHMVLWGESDAWIPNSHAEEMVKLIPNCVLKVIPDAGHSLNLENPDAFAENFQGILRGLIQDPQTGAQCDPSA
jgi:non-heme chloroperoxidase